jgi:hypothetical protein
MINTVSAVNFRQNLGEMLSQVQYRHDSIDISKDGNRSRLWSTPNCSHAFIACACRAAS